MFCASPLGLMTYRFGCSRTNAIASSNDVKFPFGNDRYAGRLQLFLAERPVVLELVGVGRAADDQLALLPQLLGFRALSQDVIEDDHVGPVGVAAPVAGLFDEPVGDFAFLFVADEVPDVVAFFGDGPGRVANQAVEGNEQEFAGHTAAQRLPYRRNRGRRKVQRGGARRRPAHRKLWWVTSTPL